MSFRFRFDSDSLTPDLAEKVKALQDVSPITMEAAKTLVEMGEMAFQNPQFRPMVWKDRKFPAAHALLMKSGQLSRSMRVHMQGQAAYITSDKPYAAIHQFGVTKTWTFGPGPGKKALKIPGIGFRKKVTIHGIPARPFLPIKSDGEPTELATKWILDAIRGKLNALLRIGPNSVSASSILGRLR